MVRELLWAEGISVLITVLRVVEEELRGLKVGWERVRLRFADRVVVFADRDGALRWVEELAERGTYPVYVVYGPEGCGKTALLRQVAKILESRGYSVSLVNPLAESVEERFGFSEDLRELAIEVVSMLVSAPVERLLSIALDLLYRAVRLGRSRRIALLADDVFQAIGVDRAEQLVKSLLNAVEYPPVDYERMVVLVSSSEGVTRSRVARHTWARLLMLWNMSREGFEELYRQLPDPKPPFEEVWRLCGGNPRCLARLYAYRWSSEPIVREIASRGLYRLASRWGRDLAVAIEDPDYLWREYPRTEQLVNELIELNMVVELWDRDYGYVDTPPPERDPVLGIGRYIAWQTPLHREAVRMVLARATNSMNVSECS